MATKQIFNTSAELDYPTVLPTLDLDFANTKTLDPRITFTRASGGSYVGADGLIKLAGVNEARFDHDPYTGESLGLLVEEARTNYHRYSTNFANWTANQATSTLTLTAETLDPSGGSGAYTLYGQMQRNAETGPGSGASFPFRGSIFVKKHPSGTNLFPFILTAAGGDSSVTVNLDTEAISSTTGSPQNVVVQAYPGGWYRVSLHITPGTVSWRPVIGGSPGATAYWYVFGMQIEQGEFPTSYIPTEGSSRTRAADFASITGKNFSSWYNQSGGTVYLEDKMLNKSLDSNTAVGFLGPDNNYRILLLRNYTGATDQFEMYHNGQQVGFNIPRTVNQYHKVAVSFKQNDIALSLDGQTPVVDTSATIPPVDRLEFGSNFGTSFIVDYTGTIRKFTYYPKRLTNQQLQALTR